MRNQQGVVVTLIVFIVLTLVLGVTTYFGFKGMTEKKAELATALSELNSARSENETLSADFAAFKSKLGYDSPNAKEIVESMTADVKAALGDAAADKTFKAAVADLGANIATMNQKIADCAKERDAQIATAQKQIETAAAQKKAFEQSVAESQADYQKSLDDARANYDKLTKSFNEQTQEFDVLKSQTKDALAEAKQETDTLREAANSFAEINLDLSKRIDQLTNAEFDTPDAEVLTVDQEARIVRLNIGEEDGVRQLTKFNVFSADALEKGGVKAKGSVQIIRTLGAHVSEAKIVSDYRTNPIQSGDIVFTPLWEKGDFNKYALVYALDVNGDGISDLDEITNLIQANGGVVAAYIDDSGVVQGKMSPDVFRIVVTDDAIESRAANAKNLDEAARAKLVETEKSFRESAAENGVREIRLADFLVQAGYKKTPQVSRYQEEREASARQANSTNASVANEPTIPIFTSNGGATAGAPGSLAPLHAEGAEESVDQTDTYFRKRTPRN